MTNPVYCLSIHADYSCRRTGACCTSAWPIPVEAPLVGVLRRAIDDGSLIVPRAEGGPGEPFAIGADLPPGAGAILRPGAGGACAFYDRGSGLCAIQRDLGHDTLPSSCQHFPRVCLLDRDRAFVSLSHYCPTAARLLFRTGGGLSVVEAPAAFAGHPRLEGLDASEALPPLVRPGLLADRDGYRAWERLLVSILATAGSPEAALDWAWQATEQVRRWKPGSVSLAEAVAAAGAAADGGIKGARGETGRSLARARERFLRACTAVPSDLERPAVPGDLAGLDAEWVAPGWDGFARPLGRYLAARAFGNWCAWQGMGLRTVVEFLETALAAARVEAVRACGRAGRPLDEALLVEAIRAADLLLVHLAAPDVLAHRLGAVEDAPLRGSRL